MDIDIDVCLEIRCIIGAVLALLAVGLAAPRVKADSLPDTAWHMEFNDTAELSSAVVTLFGRDGDPSPPPEAKDVRVENGALHLGGKFSKDSKPGEYVKIEWNNLPEIDTRKYPILEVRWRIEPKFAPYDVAPQYDLLWSYVSANGKPGVAYTTGPYDVPGQWKTVALRFAPDSSAPGLLTPKSITSITMQVGARMCREPAWIDVDYLRVRSFTAEEAEAEKTRAEILSAYKPPAIPERIRDVFLYGMYGVGSRLTGGPEGSMDELVRCHMNLASGASSDPETLKAARDRGVRLIVSPGNMESKIVNEGIEAGRKEAEAVTAKFKDEPGIIGWYIRDEPLPPDLWGVVAAKYLLEKNDPQKMGLFIIHSTDIIEYYDRFSTVAWTDRYPFSSGQRDPYSIGEWCREINRVSSRRQWFTPQAFGDAEWFRGKEGFDYYRPSLEQFRLMMHLALANGAKAFAIFIYQVNLCTALADQVGNPTDLLKEATRLGEMWSAIGPLLLDARPIADQQFKTASPVPDKKGLNVGAMGDPASGPVYMVVTNEDLATHQGGRVELPAGWGRGRAVYDLYSLKKVSRLNMDSFDSSSLAPGDGRIYALATAEQFERVSNALLINRSKEALRVQQADRLIAANWGLALTKYDAEVAHIRSVLGGARLAFAVRACRRAGEALDRLIRNNPDLAACRTDLAWVKESLGQANLAIYRGADMPRDGKSGLTAPLQQLCERYGDLRRDYILGNKQGLREKVSALRTDTVKLLADAGGK